MHILSLLSFMEHTQLTKKTAYQLLKGRMLHLLLSLYWLCSRCMYLFQYRSTFSDRETTQPTLDCFSSFLNISRENVELIADLSEARPQRKLGETLPESRYEAQWLCGGKGTRLLISHAWSTEESRCLIVSVITFNR